MRIPLLLASLTLAVVSDRADAQPTLVWTRSYGGEGSDFASAVHQTPDGGYFLVGSKRVEGRFNYDAWVVKTDSAGHELWSRTYGGSSLDRTGRSALTRDGGLIVVGSTHSFGAKRSDLWLLRIDPEGDTLWTRMYGGPAGDYGEYVEQTSDGGFVVTGATASWGSGKEDVWVLKITADGDTIWSITYGGTHNDFGEAVLEARDGSYVVAGKSGDCTAPDCSEFLTADLYC